MAIPTPPQAAVAPAAAPPDLAFSVQSAEPLERAATPTIVYKLAIERAGGGPVRSIALNTQIRIGATRRAYDEQTRERLREVFGAGEAWGRNLHSVPWLNVMTQVPAFEDRTTIDLAVPCSYDFEITAAKYLHALRDGDVPLEFLFSGSIFYAGDDGRLQISLVPWEKDADFGMPVEVWRRTMDLYFPGSAWLRVGSDSFDRLHAYRSRNALPSWDRALDALIDEAEEGD